MEITSRTIYSEETQRNTLNLRGQRKMLEKERDLCVDHLQMHPTASKANLAYYVGRIQQIDYTIDLLKGNPQEPIKPLFDIDFKINIKLTGEEKDGNNC